MIWPKYKIMTYLLQMCEYIQESENLKNLKNSKKEQMIQKNYELYQAD